MMKLVWPSTSDLMTTPKRRRSVLSPTSTAQCRSSTTTMKGVVMMIDGCAEMGQVAVLSALPNK